jgi:PilZ domain
MSDPFNLPSPIFGANRREHDRRTLRTTAAVLFGAQSLEVRTLDVSESGLAISAAVNPHAGTRFRIAFSLPRRPQGYTEISAEVEVISSVLSNSDDGFRIGLRFLALGAAMRDAIVQYVK